MAASNHIVAAIRELETQLHQREIPSFFISIIPTEQTSFALRQHSDPLKHTTTLFALFDHYILSREWRVIVDQVQTNYHGRPRELSSVRDPHEGRMCFKSVKTLGALHS